MRLLIAMLVSLCAACDSGGGTSPETADASPGGVDGGSDCPVPSTGHLAFTRETGGTRSTLWLIAEAAGGWDGQVGTFTLDTGGQPVVTQIVALGNTHYAFMDRFVATYDPTPVNEQVVVHQIADMGQGFDAMGPAVSFFLGTRNNELFCIDTAGDEVSLGYTGTTCDIVGLHGTCEHVAGGDYTVEVLTDCTDGMVFAAYEKVSGPVTKTFESPPLAGVHDLNNLGTDNYAGTKQGKLYKASATGIEFVRDTRLCVGPGNPFNGSTLAIGSLE